MTAVAESPAAARRPKLRSELEKLLSLPAKQLASMECYPQAPRKTLLLLQQVRSGSTVYITDKQDAFITKAAVSLNSFLTHAADMVRGGRPHRMCVATAVGRAAANS